MFGYGSEHHYHTHNVTEKRAATDESVRLLKEMEDEARKKITETTTVHNTEFVCKLHKYHDALNAADRKSTRLNSSHRCISYAVFCLKKKLQ